MKKWSFIFILVICMFILTGCGGTRRSRSSPAEEVVQRFVNAISEADVNAMLDCLNPSYRKILDIVDNSVNEVDIYTLLEAIPEFKNLLETEEGINVDLEIVDMETEKVSDKEVNIYTTIGIKGYTDEENVTIPFNLKCSERKWYICFLS